MGIKLYAFKQSTCSQRVLTVLAEKELPYEFVEIDITKGDQKSAAHIARHPFGKIPVLEDDGLLIFESRAITRYLAKKYASKGTKLVPGEGDFSSYALFEQAASVEQSYFNPNAEGIAIEKLFKGFRGQPTDEVKLKEYVSNLESTLATYDTILAKQSFLAGNEITLADLAHLPYIRINKMVGYADLYEKHPNVKRWSEALEARESWNKVISL